MKRPEQEIHKAVVAHLNARAERGTVFFHTPNGGKRGIREATIFKTLGVQAGVPDLIIFRKGESFGLELKATKGRLSASQVSFMKMMEDAGAKTAVAHSLDEALITLEVWGILKRGSVAA